MVNSQAGTVVPKMFTFHVNDFRVHPIPGILNAKIGSCYIRASDLVNHLDLDDWLQVNPRVPNRTAKDVLSGHVVKGIRETLEGAPEDFAIKNQGLFLLVEKIGDYQRQRNGGQISITLSNPENHGLCNGGHSYSAIREFSESASDPSTLDDAWIRLHVFEGIDADKVAAMAEGLNSSKQVDDPSLLNLRGHFKDIENHLSGKYGSKEIAYHQGDEIGRAHV